MKKNIIIVMFVILLFNVTFQGIALSASSHKTTHHKSTRKSSSVKKSNNTNNKKNNNTTKDNDTTKNNNATKDNDTTKNNNATKDNDTTKDASTKTTSSETKQASKKFNSAFNHRGRYYRGAGFFRTYLWYQLLFGNQFDHYSEEEQGQIANDNEEVVDTLNVVSQYEKNLCDTLTKEEQENNDNLKSYCLETYGG